MTDSRCVPSGDGYILRRPNGKDVYVSKEAIEDAQNWTNRNLSDHDMKKIFGEEFLNNEKDLNKNG